MGDETGAADAKLTVDEWAAGAAEEVEPPARDPELTRAERRVERRARMIDWALPVILFIVPALALGGIAATLIAARTLGDAVNQRADTVVASNDTLSVAVGQQATTVGRLSSTVEAMAIRQNRLDAIAAALAKLETAQSDDERRAATDELRRAGETSVPPSTTTTTTTPPPRRGTRTTNTSTSTTSTSTTSTTQPACVAIRSPCVTFPPPGG